MASEIDFRLISPPGLERTERAESARGIGGPPGQVQGGGFGEQLGKAIGELDKLQMEADGQAQAIANGGGNLHEVALAFEKADVAIRLATKVRNKVVDVYNEIMRMSV
jgi:flagellar hook-basal body complex protein FliE